MIRLIEPYLKEKGILEITRKIFDFEERKKDNFKPINHYLKDYIKEKNKELQKIRGEKKKEISEKLTEITSYKLGLN